jgi:aspartate/methionine/tyrosine aminotransferase
MVGQPYRHPQDQTRISPVPEIVMKEIQHAESKIQNSGGWSMLLNVGSLGYDSFTASRLLLEEGKVAATPMRDWGKKNSDQFVRLVFSNEPVHRLSTLRERIGRALKRS